MENIQSLPKLKLIQLKSDLDLRFDVLHDCYDLFSLLKYMHLKEENEDTYISYIKNYNIYFTTARAYNWRLFVIELSKLFKVGKGDDCGLVSLISKMELHYRELKISNNVIGSWKSSIGSQQEILENIFLQRDKNYAHSERGAKNISNIAKSGNCEALLKIAEEILNTIHLKAFNETRSIVWLNPSFEELKSILQETRPITEKLRKKKLMHNSIITQRFIPNPRLRQFLN
ncbi:MAG: hypothetical protein V4543_09200 [Bacteroidota bacterium]